MAVHGAILRTYLNYGGNCEEAFRFYEQNLGAKITRLMRFSEMGGMPGQFPAEWKDKVLHARLEIGGAELMASDAPPDKFQPMRSVYLSLSVDSDEEAERIYAVLSEGGQVFMPMQETFYAFRFGMLRDRFGTSWMVAHNKPEAA